MISNKTVKENKCPMNGYKLAEFNKDLFVAPNQKSKCTWKLGKNPADSPHTKRPLGERTRVQADILQAIGHTPLVRLNKIPLEEGVVCQMYVKCEFMNPGGSVKDRIGYRMIMEAEAKGLIRPGSTIIEPTSGNTGIALAMVCAVKGYRCIIVMPEKMSDEKVFTLRALGAEIIRTPTEAAFDSPESLIAVAQRLQRSIPNSYILDQYRNSGNPLAHYDGTAGEILWQLNNKVDMVVASAGTGGTLSGLGRRFKEEVPSCKVIGADPLGSILARPEPINKTDVTFFEVEGIGYDFVPTVLDHNVIDKWIKVRDVDTFAMARRLQRDEGILCGGSGGTNMYAAIQMAKTLREDQVCVVVLPDSIRNYMSKFVDDNWLEAKNLKESINVNNYSWWHETVKDLNLTVPKVIKINESCGEVIQKMKQFNLEQMPIVDAAGEIKGMATRPHLLNRMLNDKLRHNAEISKAIYKQFIKVDGNTTLGRVSRILERDAFILVTNSVNPKIPVGVITKEIFLNYIYHSSEWK